jgi:hypothetical protein
MRTIVGWMNNRWFNGAASTTVIILCRITWEDALVQSTWREWGEGTSEVYFYPKYYHEICLGAEQNHEMLYSRRPVPWPIFEPGTSGIKVEIITAWSTCFVWKQLYYMREFLWYKPVNFNTLHVKEIRLRLKNLSSRTSIHDVLQHLVCRHSGDF